MKKKSAPKKAVARQPTRSSTAKVATKISPQKPVAKKATSPSGESAAAIVEELRALGNATIKKVLMKHGA
jgi:hypothetical protein